MRRFRNAGPKPESLASGRVLAPGEIIELDELDPADERPEIMEIPDVEPVPYDKRSVEDLETLAADRGLNVVGTGASGNVIKSDLVDAHEAFDAQQAAASTTDPEVSS